MHRPTKILLISALLAGILLLSYPAVSDAWNTRHQTRAIAVYSGEVAAMDTSAQEEMWESAQEYNERLYEEGTGSLTLTAEAYALYESELDVTGTGIMSYLEIPAIDVYLPIYHGTDEGVLQIAVGHIEGTSLPVGGSSTHAVLSGHTGLTSARLFTDLDQLQIGDIFLLHTLGRTLTYEIDQILVVLPDEVSELAIREGEDLVTLVTCTPYGINTHRLLVRGHRVANSVTDVTITLPKGIREVLLMGNLILMLTLTALGLAVLILLLAIALRRQSRSAPPGGADGSAFHCPGASPYGAKYDSAARIRGPDDLTPDRSARSHSRNDFSPGRPVPSYNPDGLSPGRPARRTAGWLTALLCSALVSTCAGKIEVSAASAFTLTIRMEYAGEAISGGEFSLYRVGEWQEKDGQIGYEWSGDFMDCSFSLGNTLTEGSAADRESAAAVLTEYIEENGIEPERITGERVISGLADGVYLLVQTGNAEGFLPAAPFLFCSPSFGTDGDGSISRDDELTVNIKLSPEPAESGPPETEEEPPGETPPGGTLIQTGQLRWPVIVLLLLGALLIAAGASLALFLRQEEGRAGQASEDILREITADTGDAAALQETDPAVQQDSDEEAILGVLRIPSLDLELPVYSDWSYEKLKAAPCRYAGSLEEENLVIAGHNYDSHFGRLGTLQGGEEVLFTTADGTTCRYIVDTVEILPPDAVDAMTQSGWPLTLYTCTWGGARRVTVRCRF